MAATGFVLIGFVVGHLVGNLPLVFSPPEKINAYAHFLQSLGPVLWVVRCILLVTVILHIWVAISLVMENRKARGTENYAAQKTLRASYASRTMRYSGVIVLAFLVYHLMHFTVRSTHGEHYYPMTHIEGVEEPVPDVHSMMVLGFQQPAVSAFYLIAIALLSWHLNHGLASMFQSLGLRSRAWSGCLEKAALVFSILYFLGNAAIVGSVWSGRVKVQNDQLRIAMGEICSTDCKVCEILNETK